MKKILILFSALLLQAVAATVFAQNSNTVISGIVLDEVTNEPITGARVMETDENFDSVYSFLSADVNGRFSFTLHETDNVLRVSYADYQSVKMPLDNDTKVSFPCVMRKVL